MNQVQLDGITKARLTANLDLAALGKPLYDSDAAYVAFVTQSANLTELPDSAADSYAAQHADKAIADLEAELVVAVQKATDEGLYGGTAQEPEPSITVAGVPVKVTMRQARLALLNAGLLATVNASIAALPSPQKEMVQIEWEYSQVVERNRPFVALLGGALGLTGAQLDGLFVLAATL